MGSPGSGLYRPLTTRVARSRNGNGQPSSEARRSAGWAGGQRGADRRHGGLLTLLLAAEGITILSSAACSPRTCSSASCCSGRWPSSSAARATGSSATTPAPAPTAEGPAPPAAAAARSPAGARHDRRVRHGRGAAARRPPSDLPDAAQGVVHRVGRVLRGALPRPPAADGASGGARTARGRRRGIGARLALGGSLAAGLVLALALLSSITGWDGHDRSEKAFRVPLLSLDGARHDGRRSPLRRRRATRGGPRAPGAAAAGGRAVGRAVGRRRAGLPRPRGAGPRPATAVAQPAPAPAPIHVPRPQHVPAIASGGARCSRPPPRRAPAPPPASPPPAPAPAPPRRRRRPQTSGGS